MGQIGKMIASTGSIGPINAQRLLNGVTPANFARLARPWGVVVHSNHPAFAFGHLGLYPARVMERLGLPRGETSYPAEYEALFKSGVECRDDSEGVIYPPMATITSWFFADYRQALAALSEASDEVLCAPNPAEGRMRELFPTLGAMLMFYVDGHVQNHLGQLSAWRRAMGMPPA